MNDYLTSNCEKCFGLCCVALPYGKSADFPFDKAGGEACRHLCSTNKCSIHNDLKSKGFNGCVSYECFGAGQHVSQHIFQGADWRDNKENADEMFTVFPIVQQIHEMLWYLNQVLEREETSFLHSELKAMYDETKQLTNNKPANLIKVDLTVHRMKVNTLLLKASEVIRRTYSASSAKVKKKSNEYIGANFNGKDLKGVSFRGALLIAADLRNTDMRKVDFIGADLRDANLSNADLRGSFYLTQSQINSAKGNNATRLPAELHTPKHWQSEKRE